MGRKKTGTSRVKDPQPRPLFRKAGRGEEEESLVIQPLSARHVDRFQRAFQVVVDVRIPKAQHVVTTRFQMLLAIPVVLRAANVRFPVQLDDQHGLTAQEIGDVGLDRTLPAKLKLAKRRSRNSRQRITSAGVSDFRTARARRSVLRSAATAKAAQTFALFAR